MAYTSDGSLIFDARVDTSSVDSDLKDLYRKLNDTSGAIAEQTAVVKDLEKGYEELNDALEGAQRNEDPRRIRAYSNSLKEVGAELEQAKDRLAALKALQTDIRSEIRTTGSDFAGQVQKITSGVTKITKLISRMFTRFIGAQIIYKGLMYIKDSLIATMPQFQELQANLKNLAVEFLNVAAPLIQIFTPALKQLINILTQVANTVYNVIAALVKVFGGDLPERIESIPENLKKAGKQAKRASKNFAAFDEIMQIGQNAMVTEADAVSAAMAKANKAAKETDKTTESIKDKLLNFLKELGTISLAGLFLPKTASFLGFLHGLGKTYKAYKDMFENGITWSNLVDGLEGFAETVASAVGFVAAVGWFKSAKGWTVISVVLIAEAMCMLYAAYKDIFTNGITWENLSLTLAGFATAVASAITTVTIGKFVKKGSGMWGIWLGFANTVSFLLIAAGMCGLYLAFKDAFTNGITWENLTLGLASFGLVVAAIIMKIKISKMAKGAGASEIGKAGEAAGNAKSPTSAWKILGAGLAIVAPFLLLAAGMCAIYLAFPKAFENGINWSNICQGLESFAAGVGIALGLGLAATLILKKTGNSVWTLLAAGLGVAVPFLVIAAGMCAIYTAFPKVFENGIDWGAISKGLGKFAALVGTAIGIGTVVQLTLGGEGIFAILAGGLAAAAPFLLIAAGMCAVYTAFPKAFEDGFNWANICKGLGKFGSVVGSVITVGALVAAFTGGAGLLAILAGGLAAAAPFLLIAVGMCMVWNKYKDAFDNGIQWDKLTLGLKNFATDLAEALKIKSQAKLGTITGGLLSLLTGGVSKMAPFLLIATAIAELYKEYKDVFDNGVQWDNLVKGLDDFCNQVKNAFETLNKNITNWWKNNELKKVMDQTTTFFKNNKSNFRVLQTGMLQNEQAAVLDAAQNVPVSTFRYSGAVTGNLPGISRVISPATTSSTTGTSDALNFDMLTAAFTRALQNSGYGTAVMQVDGTTFAQLVYKYNGAETARVGVNLLSKE